MSAIELKKLFISAIWLNGAAAVTAGCIWAGYGLLGDVVAVGFLVTAFFLGIIYRTGLLIWAGLCGMLAASLGGQELRDYLALRSGKILHAAAVEQLAEDPAAGGSYLRESEVRTDLGSWYYSDSVDGVGYWHYAAPVVPKDWNRSEPIFLWAACPGVGDCQENWKKPLGAVVKIYRESSDHWRAVEDAIKRHSLRKADSAVLVEWVASPERTITGHYTAFWSTLENWNIVWAIGCFLTPLARLALRRLRRDRRNYL